MTSSTYDEHVHAQDHDRTVQAAYKEMVEWDRLEAVVRWVHNYRDDKKWDIRIPLWYTITFDKKKGWQVDYSYGDTADAFVHTFYCDGRAPPPPFFGRRPEPKPPKARERSPWADLPPVPSFDRSTLDLAYVQEMMRRLQMPPRDMIINTFEPLEIRHDRRYDTMMYGVHSILTRTVMDMDVSKMIVAPPQTKRNQ